MNLAIEYIVRSGIAKDLLQLPCSLFTVDISGNKRVITIHECYNLETKLVVKHWEPEKSKESDALPPFKEFIIDKENLFTSEHIIIKNYNILKFQENPFRGGSRQTSDPPYSDMQKNEYEGTLSKFMCTSKHKQARERWLWKSFLRVYNPALLGVRKYFYNNEETIINDQQETVARDLPNYWKYWLTWKKYLLNFDGIASELVFKKEYDSMWGTSKKPEPKQLMLIPPGYGRHNYGSWAEFMQSVNYVNAED